MPDLGKYAFDVLLAYGLSFVLIFALITLTWAQSRAAKRQLARAEARLKER